MNTAVFSNYFISTAWFEKCENFRRSVVAKKTGMILKGFLSFYLVLAMLCVASAQKVSTQLAENVARNHLDLFQIQERGDDTHGIALSQPWVIAQDADTLFYIFNVEANRGFVIVSADQRAVPVLGFVPSGAYSTLDQPPSFSSFMQSRKEQLLRVIHAEKAADPGISYLWELFSERNVSNRDEVVGIEPMMSVNWNQGCGYNAHCPEDPMGPCGRAYAGCVATAMGQIMKYWNYPDTGRGANTYNSQYGELSVDFSQHHYLWNNMPPDAASDEVAKLLYHVGVSVEMNYTAHESAAYSYKVRDALADHFKYSFRTKYNNISNASEQQIIAMMLEELYAGRVMYYGGCPDVPSGNNPCHAFVVDGYMSYAGHYIFHFNFGWSGNYNGYFYVHDLAASGGDYTYDNPTSLITNIEPANCSAFSIPFVEDFEMGTSSCWQSFNNGSRNFNWEESLVQNRTPGGTTSAMHSYWSFSQQPEESYLLSPPIVLPANPDPGIVLSFWSKNFCPDLYDNGKNSVLISTDGGVAFTQVWEAVELYSQWTKTTVDLSTFAGHTIRIAFLYEKFQDANAHTWFLDDVKVALDYPEPPEVATIAVYNISSQDAQVIGRVLFQGNSPVNQRGFVWSTQPQPTLANNTGMVSQSGGEGAFHATITALNDAATYYLRAWAINEQGTTYGNEISFVAQHTPFVCGESTVTDIDGNVYPTVQIGNQCWLADNLKTTSYRNGEALNNPNCIVNFINNEWGADQQGAWIAWNNSETFRKDFGAIYNHHAVSNPNRICPAHWHVPHDFEWMHLESNLGMSGDVAGVLGWRGDNEGSKLAWRPEMWVQDNLIDDPEFGNSGFNALPVGWYPFPTFGSGNDWPDEDVAWWSSTAFSGGFISRRIAYDQTGIERSIRTASQGHYVRCLRNMPTLRTQEIRDVTHTTAEGGGWLNVYFNDEGANVVNKGLVWNTTGNPTLENHSGIKEFGGGAENFYHTFSGLTPGKAYYKRAFAESELGLIYGEEIKFYTLDHIKPCPDEPVVTDIQGNTYNTVWIGDQCWLTQNLRVTVNPYGEPIERICPENDPELCTTFGGLYRWETMVDGFSEDFTDPIQGICPAGWHLPGNDQWSQLEDFLISHGYNYDHTLQGNFIAQSMAAGQLWLSIGMMPTGSPGQHLGKNNSSGFSALPAGSLNANGSWVQPGLSASFWSATPHSEDPSESFARSLFFRDRELKSDTVSKNSAMSVRCVRSAPSSSTQNLNNGKLPGIIYPNPSNGRFILRLFEPSLQGDLLEVYDIAGRKFFSFSLANANHELEVDLSGNTPGVYYLKLYVGGNWSVMKLLLLD